MRREPAVIAAAPTGARRSRPAPEARTPLQALADHGPQAARLGRLQDAADHGRRQAAQLRLADPVQRAAVEEEEPLQAQVAQRAAVEEEEPLQARVKPPTEEQEIPPPPPPAPGLKEEEPLQARTAQREAAPNRTGMPDALKTGIEALSGLDMSEVRVRANSSKPAEVGALAYAQGNDIHLGPGQEQHLPHEAWHVVQQRQGRVQPTIQAAGVAINDDPALEHEADVMGARALQRRAPSRADRNQL
jgi:hypothetical protein